MSEWTESQRWRWPKGSTKGVVTKAMPDGNVALAIYFVSPETGAVIRQESGILLTPEVARIIAANLTWESMKAEEVGE